MKRSTQTQFITTVGGRRRWCAVCGQMVSTQKGRFVQHGRTDQPTFICPTSGKSVKQATTEAVG